MNPLVTNVYLEVRSLFLNILLKAQDVFRQTGTDSMCSDSSHILSLNLNKDTWCYQSRNVFLFSFFFLNELRLKICYGLLCTMQLKYCKSPKYWTKIGLSQGVYSFCLSIWTFIYTFCHICGSFTLKFLRWVYLSNNSSESIHTWVMGTLEGLLTFHKFLPPGFMPRGGAGGQNLGHLKC